MWNMYSLDGPHTNNNAEGWHSKICKLAGKAHPNIYKLAVELFKAEQTATEVSLMQLAAGGLPVRRRRNYRRHEKRLLTIKEKYEASDYTLSELVKVFSNWVSFSGLDINHCDAFSLTKKKKKNLDEMGHLHFLLDEMGLDKMGLDEMG